jgi:hypothetical protein
MGRTDPIRHALELLEEGDLFYLGEYAVTEHHSGTYVMRIGKGAVENLGITPDSVLEVWVDKGGRRIVVDVEDEDVDETGDVVDEVPIQHLRKHQESVPLEFPLVLIVERDVP